MMKNAPSRRSKDEMKHEAILKAATRLFLKNGYTNTSMDAIAEMARVTKQTVYSHYQNKDVLFTLMVSSLCERESPSIAVLENSTKPIETLLYDIGLVLLDMITSKDVLAATRLVIAETHQHHKLAERYYEAGTQRLIEMMSQFLGSQNKRGVLAIPDTASAASYFIAILKGGYYLRMILAIKPTPSKQEKEAHIRETVQIFMRIYGGPEPMATKSIF
jgi:TetR/AcrR family transcriptional regulator, mexJK operon transcriptional repressor